MSDRIPSTGQANTTTSAMVPISTGTGCRITQSLHRRQNTSPAFLRPRTRSAFTRGPSRPSNAGSSVRAPSTLTRTTSAPPRPIERSDMYGMIMRPSRPTTTVRPLKKMERPAVATVVSTASATLRPAASSSRNRPTMNSA